MEVRSVTGKADTLSPNAVVLEESALDQVTAGSADITLPQPEDETALKKLPGKRSPPTVTLKRG